MSIKFFPSTRISFKGSRSHGPYRVLVLLAVLIVLLGTACGGSVTTDPTSPDSQGTTGGGGTGTGTNNPPPSSGNGTASLSWVAPTKLENGAPLTDLAGYHIYYGTTSAQYTNSIDAGLGTSYLVTELLEGQTYYFTVTAYDSNGTESDYSAEVSKYIN